MHILGLARNLLAISMLNDVGVQVVFSKDGCKMMRGSMVLAKGTRRGTLFQLDACIAQCNISSISKKRVTINSSPPSERAVKKTVAMGSNGSVVSVPKGANTLEGKLPAEKTMLWHMRFGHTSEKGLRTLKTKNLIEGLNDCNLEFDFCEHCVYGKQNHVQFYSSSHKSSRLLDLIHSDVFGPVKVPSISSSIYFVSFIDDYSRRTWIYFLKSKTQVFSRFKEFKALVENQTGKRIKCVRTDNGGEFCSIEFE